MWGGEGGGRGGSAVKSNFYQWCNQDIYFTSSRTYTECLCLKQKMIMNAHHGRRTLVPEARTEDNHLWQECHCLFLKENRTKERIEVAHHGRRTLAPEAMTVDAHLWQECRVMLIFSTIFHF